jgi:hypothetical protein
MFGNTYYSAKAGVFLSTARVELMDYKHFNGNQTVFGVNYRDGFHLLDYYSASTTAWFTEAHFQHSFEGLLFNKIPLIRKLKLQEVFSVNFMYSDDYHDYTELCIGIENILRVMRVDFIFGLSSRHANLFGVTFGVDFRQL